MANLYEISQAMLDCIDQETGEIVDIEKLSTLAMERDTKIENIALWIKNLAADMEAYKREKDAFAEREKAAKSKCESLKRYLTEFLDGEKFSSERVAISFRNSKTVAIAEWAKLPDEYIRRKVTEEPDKTAIAAALKAGETIAGCELVPNRSIQIK
nr:MAG TPA: resistance protein [Caudoviricetes sp.]